MAIGPHPEFSWSHSRDGLFQRCERKYYFQYYGKWGGWSKTASPRRQTTYLLTQLTGLSAWAGSAVHESIALYLHTAPNPSRWMEETRNKMRRQYLNSLRRVFQQPGKAKTFGLEEHHYDHDLTDEVVRGAWQKVESCLQAFTHSPIATQIKKAQEAGRYVYIEPPTSDFLEMRVNTHPFGDFPVYAQPDVVFEDENGVLHLLDWKTGQTPSDRGPTEVPPQLAFYLLWLREKGEKAAAWPYERIKLAEVYLPSLQEFGGTPTEQTWLEAKERAEQSISAMRRKCKDPVANQAEEEAFSLTLQSGQCSSCVFRSVCPSEAAVQACPSGQREG